MTGTVPVIFVGLAFRVQIEEIFNNLKFVGIALVITGILNFLTDQAKEIKKEISVKNSFLIGIAQAIAIIPGISRSGSTIFASTSLGIKKEKAAEFSFLLSIPAVLGANLLEFIHYKNFAFVNLWFYVSGFIFAFISGIIAINLALKLLKNKGFKIFSYYCLIVGLVVFILL
jgi:undecaprenyl-diphosphatase